MVDFDPFSESYYDDPFPIYARMRADAPALYLEKYDCFFLSRFQDCWDSAADGRFSTSAGTTSIDLLLEEDVFAGKPLTPLGHLDPPRHTQVRKRIAPYFLPREAGKLEALARKLAGDFLDEALAHGRFDVIGDYAMRLSVRIAFTILGLPLEDADHVAGRVNTAFQRTWGEAQSTAAAQSARGDLGTYLEHSVEERRRRPTGAGLLEHLMTMEVEGKQLSREELLGNLQLVVIGGTETLPKAFAGAIHRLHENPEQRAEVISNPALLPDAFWEALRIEMPTLMLGRKARVEAEIAGGTRVMPGQKLMFLWASANRDEREFHEPDRFDIHRRAPRILSFSHATHRCMGAHFALMEGQVLLGELLARAPEYVVLEGESQRLRSEFFRGFSKLPIEV